MTFLSRSESAELERAIAHYRTLLEAGAATPFDLHNLALACYRVGDHDAAYHMSVRSLEIERPGERARTFHLQGLIFRAVGELERAIEAFGRALDDGGPRAECHFERAACFHQLGELERAEADFARSLELAPSLSTTYNLGVVYAASKKWGAAIECFSACLGLDPYGRDEYISLLVQCGKAEARQEVYVQGHRMKNLLGVLGNELRVLERDLVPQLPEGGGQRIERLRDRLERIYGDMVQYLKILQQDGDPPDLVDLNEVVSKVLFLASASLRGIDVQTRLSDRLPGIVAPPNQLSEVLLNIVINAVEAQQGQDDAALLVETTADAAEVRVTIADNGPGLHGKIDRMFELGYTTKEFGSGIGLAHASNLVAALGGRIEAGDREEGGARFTVVLPLAPDSGLALGGLAIRGRGVEDFKELLIRNGAPPKLEPDIPREPDPERGDTDG